MRERYAARVYLFGSRVRGSAGAESDYDVVVVSRCFEGQRRISRAVDLYPIWHEAGGWGMGLDVHCYTPEEFRAEVAGLGYLGHAKRRGELIRLST
jgi:predicted nucleotidyltransferase